MRGDFLATIASVFAQFTQRIEYWWQNASAADFGALALCVVVCVWFVARYYSD